MFKKNDKGQYIILEDYVVVNNKRFFSFVVISLIIVEVILCKAWFPVTYWIADLLTKGYMY